MFAIGFHNLLNGGNLEVDSSHSQKNSELSFLFTVHKMVTRNLEFFMMLRFSKFQEDFRLSANQHYELSVLPKNSQICELSPRC